MLAAGGTSTDSGALCGQGEELCDLLAGESWGL
jgi:hypothetical protein